MKGPGGILEGCQEWVVLEGDGGGYQGGKCGWVKYHLITLGTDHNSPIAYAPGTELHFPIMSTLGGHGDPL